MIYAALYLVGGLVFLVLFRRAIVIDPDGRAWPLPPLAWAIIFATWPAWFTWWAGWALARPRR